MINPCFDNFMLRNTTQDLNTNKNHLYNPIPICKTLKNLCPKTTGCVQCSYQPKKFSDQSLIDILKKDCNYFGTFTLDGQI